MQTPVTVCGINCVVVVVEVISALNNETLLF